MRILVCFRAEPKGLLGHTYATVEKMDEETIDRVLAVMTDDLRARHNCPDITAVLTFVTKLDE